MPRNPLDISHLLDCEQTTSCQAETHLVFPKSASVEKLKLIRESIATERDQRLREGCPVQPAPVPAAASAAASSTAAANLSAASPAQQPPSVVNKDTLTDESESRETLIKFGHANSILFLQSIETSLDRFVTNKECNTEISHFEH